MMQALTHSSLAEAIWMCIILMHLTNRTMTYPRCWMIQAAMVTVEEPVHDQSKVDLNRVPQNVGED